jgi:cold shock protein
VAGKSSEAVREMENRGVCDNGGGAVVVASPPADALNNGDTNAAADAVQMRGRLKWFDAVRGYGFVEAGDSGGDLLLHYTVLKAAGRRSLPEGATVDCTVVDGARGRQVHAILAIDLETAIGPDPELQRKRETGRTDPLDFLDGAGPFEPVSVRWFNRTKGYGFLLPADPQGTEIFIHMETVRRAGLAALDPGQPLHARISQGPKGPMAVIIDTAGPIAPAAGASDAV